MNDLHAFGRRIYIKPEEEKTLIQSDSQKNTVKGKVISAGPDCKVVREGDILLFTQWGVDEVNINGQKYFFLLESDEFILAMEREPMPSRLVAQLQDPIGDARLFDGGLRKVSSKEGVQGGGGEGEQLPISELSHETGSPAIQP